MRMKPLILSGVRFPRDVSQSDCINLGVEVSVISDRGEVAMRDKRCTPGIKELVDNTLRETGLEV